MKLSVIIPAYNEGKTLPIILQKVMDVPVDKELIVVDDGSNDDTSIILENYKNQKDIIIIRHEKNQGKGMAIRSAIEHITGHIVIIQDADLECDPQDYLKLMEPIKNGEAQVIYGVRTGPRHPYFRYYLGVMFLSKTAGILYKQNLKDIHTCYKVFEASLLKSIPLTCRGFEFCPEITARIAKRGIRIKEIPILYYPRKFAEGKKIRWVDGLIAFWTLIKYRFVD